jgi:hypothetical protein
MYFSPFTSRLFSLSESNTVSILFTIVMMFTPNNLTWWVYTKHSVAWVREGTVSTKHCRLSAKLVPTFVDRRCHVVSVTDIYGRNLGFLDRRWAYSSNYQVKKNEAIPITGRGGLLGCEMLRTPHCLDNWLTNCGKVVSLTHRPRSNPQKHFFFCFWYSFLLWTEWNPGPRAAVRIG